MTDTISVTGIVATDPKHLVTGEGLAITHFRLASTQRRYDKSNERWVDADTNWYTVTAFRQLAINASNSLKKGERVVVSGRVKIREWDNGERKGTTVDVEADALGHDLTFGSTTFSRSISSIPIPPVDVPPAIVSDAFPPAAQPSAELSTESSPHAAEESAESSVGVLADAEPVPF